MIDDLFGDLLSPKPGSSASGKVATSQPSSIGIGGSDASAKSQTISGANEERSAIGAGPAVGLTEAGVSLTSEQLSAVVEKTIQSALECSFSKFVRSLRTVLEDLTRRVASQEATLVELGATVNGLRDTIATQPADLHVRFTNLDMAVKDVERGVQALRDRQELVEAHELLARMSSETSRSKGTQATPTANNTSAASAVTAATPDAPTQGAAPLPSTSPAPAVSAPAATEIPASSAAPPAASAMVPAASVAVPAASVVPPQQQAPPYGMPVHAGAPQQMPISPNVAPGGYPMGMPGAPPFPVTQQQIPELQQPGPQPQQAPMPLPQYHPYQQQPQVGSMTPGGGMAFPPDPNPYGALQQQPQQPQQPQQQQQAPQHAPPAFSSPYGGMPAMEPPRAPSLPSHGQPHPHSMSQALPPPGAPGGGALPLSQPCHSYPAPPSGLHGYPPTSALQGVAVPSMYGRANAPPQSYRASAPPPSSSTSGSAGSRAVPLDKILADISQMGFNRGDVLAAVTALQSSGKALELNTIIDKLTRG